MRIHSFSATIILKIHLNKNLKKNPKIFISWEKRQLNILTNFADVFRQIWTENTYIKMCAFLVFANVWVN
jgi:hypothetical protein